MSEFYAWGLFLSTALIWLATLIQFHRLFYMFRERYPDHAKQIPFAFKPIAHPEKFLSFFRKKQIAVLKADPELWSIRQGAKLLLIFSTTIPTVGFMIPFCYAIFQ